MRKQNGRKIDGRTRAGRTLKRKRAAMAKARKARWAKEALHTVKGRRLSAREVIDLVLPTFTEDAAPPELPPFAAPIVSCGTFLDPEGALAPSGGKATVAYWKEIPR